MAYSISLSTWPQSKDHQGVGYGSQHVRPAKNQVADPGLLLVHQAAHETDQGQGQTDSCNNEEKGHHTAKGKELATDLPLPLSHGRACTH